MSQVTIVPLVGAHYRPPAKSILANLRGETPLLLEAEPENKFDANAVKVLVETKEIPEDQHENLDMMAAGYGISIQEILAEPKWHLGYVARDHAERLQPVLNTIKSAKLGFGSDDKPFVKIVMED